MDKKCPVYAVMNFMGKRWTILILLELYKGKSGWKRYSEVKKKLPGITPKVLSMRLKELQKEKLVLHKIDASVFPIKSKYSLTKSGEEFIKIVKAIKHWGLYWKVKSMACESTNCKECEF